MIDLRPQTLFHAMKTTNKKHSSTTLKEKDIITVHNLLILDESGSMQSIYRQALSGCNETIQSVRAADKRHDNQRHRFSLVAFNSTETRTILDDVPIAEVRDLTEEDYIPDAFTPLYDAMGRAINALERKVKEGDRVLVTIITDGEENDSKEYSLEAIRGMTGRLREKGWTFIYMGANHDADIVATRLDIRNKLTFEATVTGTVDMYRRCNKGQNYYYDKLAEMGRALGSCDDIQF